MFYAWAYCHVTVVAYKNVMTGEYVRKKIKEKGFSYRSIAQAIGESDQNFRCMLMVEDVKSGTLERIAKAMGENVAYFYNERPIFTMEEYADIRLARQEIKFLHELLESKDQTIASLREQIDILKEQNAR